LVKYLLDRNLATVIRVLDKVLVGTAFLSAEHRAAFEDPRVQFKQANLSAPASIKKHFAPDDGSTWDLVVNLAAETKYGQTEEVYKEKVLDVCQKCAAEAKELKVKKWVEVSTAQVYAPPKKGGNKEDAKLDPWTKLAKFKLDAENFLKSSGLNVSILRPAMVYGPGDIATLAPRIIVAAVYQRLDEKMKNLWSGDLAMNTVHVDDVCAAIWAAREWENGATYNLADKSETDQKSINEFLEQIFSIKTGFWGSMASNLAKTVSLKAIAEEANDKHLKPWSDLCKEQGIMSTPLSPYIDQELLYNNSLSVDGSAVESKKGFKYSHPKLTKQDFNAVIEYFEKQGLFPKNLAK
jgi:nucleoside-diphosphate-sugar epimerase